MRAFAAAFCGGASRAERSRRSVGSRGFALVIVMITITAMLILTLDFQFNSNVNLLSAAYLRDELQGYYLARSGVNYARFLLTLQQVVEQRLRQANLNLAIQLWRDVPIDSNIACMAASGVFAQQLMSGDALKEPAPATPAGGRGGAQDGPPPSPMDRIGLDLNKAVDAFSAQKRQERAEGKPVFCEFDGSFYTTIEDEERRVNVAVGPQPTEGQVNVVRQRLTSMFLSPRYNWLFERRDSEGQYNTRDDIIAAIIDWQDLDRDRQPWAGGGNEDDRYQMLDDKYNSRGSFFDTVDELQLVRGIDDAFWEQFGQQLTVYPAALVNPNSASPQVLEALFRGVLPFQIDVNQMTQWLDKVLRRKQEMGFFSDLDAFVAIVETNAPMAFSDQMRQQLRQQLTTSSSIFKVRATGEVGSVVREITVVMDITGRILYWRE